MYQLMVHPHYLEDNPEKRLLEIDDTYCGLDSSLGQKVAERIECRENLCTDNATTQEDLALRLDRFWNMPEVEGVAEILTPQLEKKIYNSYVAVNQLNTIRSKSRLQPPVASWKWHYDNYPEESVKILSYLKDADQRGGPVEYLRNQTTGEEVKTPGSRISFETPLEPRWPVSPVLDEAIEDYRVQGFEAFAVTGKGGTFILFDNNCVHRATVPERNWRDAVIYNIRPSHEKIRPFIYRQMTGSWSFNAKKWHPWYFEG